MGADAVITHALTEGDRMHYVGTQSWGPCNVTVVKPWGGQADPMYVVRPDGMGEYATYVVATSELRPVRGVTMSKAGELALPQVLIMDTGQCRGWDTVTPVRLSLRRDVVCGWCDEPASRVATGQDVGPGVGGWSDYMCRSHAFVYGRFVDAHAIVPVPGHGVAALTLDWGFFETV